MAHKIDQSTGKDAFVTYLKPAWHGLGEVLQEKIKAKDLQDLPHINYPVIIQPNSHELQDGTKIVSDNSFFTYRPDTNTILGDKLGKHYRVVQNDTLFEVVNGLGEHWVETAGVLDEGRVAFVVIKFDPIEVKGDAINMYYTFFNSHDGSVSLSAMLTPVRVVCYNTLQASMGRYKEWIKIRHTNSAEARLKLAGDILKTYEDSSQKLKETFTKMANTNTGTRNRFYDYLSNVFLTNGEIKQLKNGEHPLTVISTRRQNMLNEVIEYAAMGPGQSDGATMYDCYNAVTGYYANKNKYSDYDHRFKSLMLPGSSRNFMEKAFALAANPERIVPLAKADFNLN